MRLHAWVVFAQYCIMAMSHEVALGTEDHENAQSRIRVYCWVNTTHAQTQSGDNVCSKTTQGMAVMSWSMLCLQRQSH